MGATDKTRGAIVDRRLEPAGLTRLLGPYGESRRTVLGVALALLVGAGLTLVLFPWPPASIGMAFIVPVGRAARPWRCTKPRKAAAIASSS